MKKTISRFILSTVFIGGIFAAPAVYAQCAGPVSIEGGIDYDATNDQLLVCDGTNWIVVGPGGTISPDSIDWDDITDTMTLDATTTIDMTAGDLNFDNNTLFIDSSANRIGIGAEPDTNFHLSSGIDTRLEALITNTSTGTNVLSRTYHRNTGYQGFYTGVTGVNYTGGWLGQGGNEGFVVSSANQFNIINAHTNAPMVFMAGSNTAPSEIMRLTYDARLGIGTGGNPDANAALEVAGTDLGFLPPRNTDPATNITGTAGLIAYDSTDNELQFFNGSAWVAVATGTTSSDRIQDSDNNTYIDVDTTDDGATNQIDFYTAGSQRMVIEADGDINFDANAMILDATNNHLGIGSIPNPASPLEIRAQGDAYGTSAFALGQYSAIMGCGLQGSECQSLDRSAGFAVHRSNDANNNFYMGYRASAHMFYAEANAASPTVVIDPQNFEYTNDFTVEGTSYFNGTVGIGSATIDANAALDVNGTNLGFLPPRNADPATNITGTAGLIAYDSTDNELQYFNGSSWVSVGGGASVTPDSLDWDDFTDTMTLDATTTINMDTNTADLNFDSNTFVIDSSENDIGIGTAAPTGFNASSNDTVLHINNGNLNGSSELVLASGTNSVTGQSILSFALNNGTQTGSIHSEKTGTGLTSSFLSFGTHDGTSLAERMRIAATGELGVGTTTPTTDIHVFDDTGVAAIAVEGNEDSISGLALHTSGDGATLLGSGAGSTGWLWEAKGDIWATADEREDIFLTYWNGTTWDEWMFISHDTGHIGLGGDIDPDVLLDMPGTIKLGDGGESCDAAREGSIRYDGTGDTFYFCSTAASGWEAVSLGSGVNAINDLSDGASDGSSVFLGSGSGANDDGTTNENTGLGINAMNATTSGNRNVAIGRNSLASNTVGGNIIAIGNDAMENYTDTTSGYLIAIGNRAGRNHSSGWRNIAIGHDALMEHVNGNDHIGIGYQALMNADGQDNVGIGSNSGQYAGWRNTMIGLQAGQGTSAAGTADGNVMLGYRAGTITEDADNNTLIGFQAGDVLTTGDNNLILGYDVDPSSATASNEMNIGGTIFGNLSTGQIGIGVTDATAINANAALEVTGTNLGFLPPRNADPDGNITGVAGLIAYDSTDNELQYFDGSAWVSVGGGGGGGLWTDLTGGRIHYGTSAANQVGVGTNNPGYTLDVNGDINLPVGNTIRAGGNEMLRMIAPNDASGVHAVVIGTNSAHTNLGAGTGFNQWEGPGVYIGHNAGNSIDSTGGGSQAHVFIGVGAGQNVTTNTHNTFIGAGAGSGSNVSFGATVVGAYAGQNAGQSGVYIGRDAGGNGSLTMGNDNTVVGTAAGSDATGNFNTFIGMQSGREQRGDSNTALGYQALNGVDTTSTANDNIAIGYRAMDAVTTSNNNIAIGSNAAGSLVDGTGANVFIGHTAGSGVNTTDAYQNVAVGAYAGSAAALGYNNSFFGERAGRDTTGNFNTFIGRSAGQNVVAGSENIVLGAQSESAIFAAGDNNILIGYAIDTPAATSNNYLNIGNLIYGDLANSEVFLDAPAAAPADADLANGQVTFWVDATNDEIELKARDSAGDIINVTVGAGGGGGGGAINDLTDGATSANEGVYLGDTWATTPTGRFNTVTGVTAGENLNTTAPGFWEEGGYNTFYGHAAGLSTTTGYRNVFMGVEAGRQTTTGQDNTFLGNAAGYNSTGNDNTFVGRGAGISNTTASRNTFVGNESGWANTTGYENVAIGDQALHLNETGYLNVAVGRRALYNSTANSNTAVGGGTMENTTTGDQNSAVGEFALYNNTTGEDNVAMGYEALVSNTIGQRNTAIGYRAGYASGGQGDMEGNTIIGYHAGFGFSGGAAGLGPNFNTLIGYQAGDNITTGDYNILIGNAVDTSSATASNELNIGNLIYGDLANSEVFLDAPAAAPADADLANGQVTFWVDATNDEIELKAKDSAGDVINVTVGAGGGGGGGAIDGLSDAATDYVTDFNLFMGSNAGTSIASGGQYNLAIGQNAADAITTGDNNLAIGHNALTAGVDINDNTAIGRNALSSNTESNFSTAVGARAAQNFAPGSEYENITAFGVEAGAALTGGFGLVAIGNEALENYPGDRNTAVGSIAMFATNGGGGSDNVAMGNGAASYMAGSDNVMLGSYVAHGGFGGDYDHRGSNNVLIGKDSARNMQGNNNDQNVIIGSQTASSLRNGSDNIIIGYGLDVSSGTASGELNIGNAITGTIDTTSPYTASDITIAGNLTVTGSCTGCGGGGGGSTLNDLSDATTDYLTDNNLFLGDNAGASIASGGIRNVAIGQNAGDAITTGDNNITIGYQAGSDMTIRTDVIAIGSQAGADIGNQSIAIGTQAGFQTNGGNNVILGPFAGFSPTVGGGNIALGYSALYGGGNNTVSIGAESGNGVYNGSDADESIFLGTRAAQSITSGDRNVFIGYQVGDVTTTGSDNIIIGHNIDPSSATASNELNIGGTIYGDLSNDLVGIGQLPATGVELDVLGDIEYTGTITDVSDRRLKDNIESLNKRGSLIEKINAIDTYSFTMKDDEDGKTEFGVIAQEIEEIFPELVRTSDDDMGTKSVNYVGLIAPMIEATKELSAENAALKAELSDIKEDIAGMRIHTGYDMNKANAQNLMMMMIMMVFGGGCVWVVTRLQRKA